MAINLQKGQRISLSKEAPGLTKIICGLGWDVIENSGGGLFGVFNSQPTQNFDLDASVVCLNDQGKIADVAEVIYYNNLQHKSGSIEHLGDNLTGEGEGDDEQIVINLNSIPSNISRLVFTVTIYDCVTRKQDFKQVKNAFVRLVNVVNNQELARYNLSGQEYGGMTGLIIAEIYRHNQDWKMAAIGEGIKVTGLGDIIKSYA